MTEIVPCDFDRIASEELPQAHRIAQYFAEKYPGARVLDVGCGPGIYVTEMRKVGLQAFGVDNDSRMPKGEWFRSADLTKPYAFPPIGNFDVILSLEVGEHLPEESANDYVWILTTKVRADTIYFSAARSGQGGEGHINCRPKAYWVEKFHAMGFWLDPDATDEWLGWMRNGYHLGWLTQNGMVFRYT